MLYGYSCIGWAKMEIVGRFGAFQGISTGSCIPWRHKLIFCIYFCIITFLCIQGGRIGFLRLSAAFQEFFKIFYFFKSC